MLKPQRKEMKEMVLVVKVDDVSVRLVVTESDAGGLKKKHSQQFCWINFLIKNHCDKCCTTN